MPYARSNYRIHSPRELLDSVISASAIIDDAIIESALATNAVNVKAFSPSVIIVGEYYNSFSDFITVSMNGYGYPQFLAVVGLSVAGGTDQTVAYFAMPTQSFSGSIGWIYVYESNQLMTGTARILYMALIASR